MKYLESFKDIFSRKKPEYKIKKDIEHKDGDYVLVNSEGENGDYLYYVKLEEVDFQEINNTSSFICRLSDGTTFRLADYVHIERQLTPDEIENYEQEVITNKFEQDVNKYNL